MTRAYKGNELGLTRHEVELVHDTATACLWAIEDKVVGGMAFDAAKAAVIKQALPAWKGFGPGVAEGVRRVVGSYTYADMDRRIHRKHRDDFLAGIEKARGKKAGRIERLLYRATGLTW